MYKNFYPERSDGMTMMEITKGFSNYGDTIAIK